ncbi:MAG: DUF2225 domain-containing protein [Candidatus Lindowbacteria bacterium]|nr:DUF2225 domain-containing protein [Candidatus Lindowbacteria bacterium]
MSSRDDVLSDVGPRYFGGKGLSTEQLQILREIHRVFGGDPHLIQEFLQRFGWTNVSESQIKEVHQAHAMRLKQVHEQSTAVDTRDQWEELAKPGRDPFYQVQKFCPFCPEDKRTPVTVNVLRSKTLTLEFRYKSSEYPLMIPNAVNGRGNYRTEDPNFRKPTVCPNCLYAAIDQIHWLSDGKESSSECDFDKLPRKKMSKLREVLQMHYEIRKKIARPYSDVPGRIWSRQRNSGSAARAYILAAKCYEILSENGPKMYFYAAQSYLIAAKLCHDLRLPFEELKWLQSARFILRKAYESGRQSGLPAYQRAFVSWLLGEIDEARIWISAFERDSKHFADANLFKRFSVNLLEEVNLWQESRAAL